MLGSCEDGGRVEVAPEKQTRELGTTFLQLELLWTEAGIKVRQEC
jgi:hypothetical protein